MKKIAITLLLLFSNFLHGMDTTEKVVRESLAFLHLHSPSKEYEETLNQTKAAYIQYKENDQALTQELQKRARTDQPPALTTQNECCDDIIKRIRTENGKQVNMQRRQALVRRLKNGTLHTANFLIGGVMVGYNVWKVIDENRENRQIPQGIIGFIAPLTLMATSLMELISLLRNTDGKIFEQNVRVNGALTDMYGHAMKNQEKLMLAVVNQQATAGVDLSDLEKCGSLLPTASTMDAMQKLSARSNSIPRNPSLLLSDMEKGQLSGTGSTSQPSSRSNLPSLPTTAMAVAAAIPAPSDSSTRAVAADGSQPVSSKGE